MGAGKKRKQKNQEKRKRKKARTANVNSRDIMMTTGDKKSEEQPPPLSTATTKTDTEADESKTYHPVLVIKKPQDYSANWKKLKDIITKEDKPKHSQSSESTKKGLHSIKKKKKTTKDNIYKENENSGTAEEIDVWFDNVDPRLIERTKTSVDKTRSKESRPVASLVDTNGSEGLTDIVAMDCEMVGVGYKAKDSMLARVSIVNQHGHPIYDKFVLPMEKVEDYRTAFSGVRPSDYENAEKFFTVQREVYELIKDRVVVGHALKNDFRVLYFSHPRHQVRDTSRYREFCKLFGGRTPSLKKLTERVLGLKIQEGEHNSVQDAQAAMRLYMARQVEWEAMLKKTKRKKIAARHKRMAASKKVKAAMKDSNKSGNLAPNSRST